MEKYTGKDVRELRSKHKLSRTELANLLQVSAVTIEKWEQNPEKEIRTKYHEMLGSIGGGIGAGAGIGALAAPALLASIPFLGGAGALLAAGGKVYSDKKLQEYQKILDGLKRLTPEEREELKRLQKKMSCSDYSHEEVYNG